MAWTAKEVEGIRAMKGTTSAVNVARMYKVSAETIRRVWRGETYPAYASSGEPQTPSIFTGGELPAGIQSEADEFLVELMGKQKPEGQEDLK